MLKSKIIAPPIEGGKDAVETTTTELTPPPSYASHSGSQDVDITAAFSNLDLNTNRLPTGDLCLAHLKLLEAFHQLREDVSQADGQFGIKDDFAASDVQNERNHQLAQIREKRWQVYVSRAAMRFEKWWTSCVQPGKRLQSQISLCGVGMTPAVGSEITYSADDLPPLGKNIQNV